MPKLQPLRRLYLNRCYLGAANDLDEVLFANKALVAAQNFALRRRASSLNDVEMGQWDLESRVMGAF